LAKRLGTFVRICFFGHASSLYIILYWKVRLLSVVYDWLNDLRESDGEWPLFINLLIYLLIIIMAIE
jgi:hypothetical protein